MFGAFQTFGKLGAIGKAISAAWSPLALWPNGAASPGMWIAPSLLTASFNDYTGTTPVATPGTVADSANPVGLALDIRAGATTVSDPGHHMLQSTSAARPLMSARRNLLTYTEDISISNVYSPQLGTVSAPTYPDPFSGNSASKFTGDASSNVHRLLGDTVVGESVFSLYVKTGELRRIGLLLGNPFAGAWFDLTSGTAGVLSDYPDVIDYGIEPAENGFYRCWIHCSITSTNSQGRQIFLLPDGGTSFGSAFFAADAVGVYVTGAQLELGTTATPYQSVPGNGSTYDSTGITPFQLYDGVDDGMATASFAAGTLINGMDCMIPVRRDSAAARSIEGLYQTDHTKYFGVVGEVSGDGATTYWGCGTPSIFVDGASVTNTRGALFDALRTGEFHILEYRDLDLSSWVDAAYGNYPTYQHNGDRGDILLYPSTASTEDKDAAWKYLADKYGVTLA